MTTSRLAILLAVLLGGMSSVFILPQQLGFQPVGIRLELPEYLGQWWGRDLEISQKERDTLGHDTEFARKSYTTAFGDSIMASIVLAGQDMMTSIHRPERCLQAQGWTTGDDTGRTLQVPGLGALHATRLRNSKTVTTADGRAVVVDSICYYWFVGHTDRTASHGERVWLDARDRLIKGYNQRWAMVMINAEITKAHSKFGRDEKQTDALLQEFIKLLAPKLEKVSG